MGTTLKNAVVMLALLTILTGVIFPLAITLVGQALMPAQANGSLITTESGVVGSALIGQASDDPRYFWPRPSASGYGALPSGASNAGPTSATLAEAVQERADALRLVYDVAEGEALPNDLLFASGSGLDPHISPEAALLQASRVADARQYDATQRAALDALVAQFTEPPQFGVFGQPRVNVLMLNVALDELA